MQTDTQPDGIVDVGQRLKKDDIIVNKCIQISQISSDTQQETEPEILPRPLRYKYTTRGTASRVLLTSNGTHSMMVKVMTDQTRIPEVGDKFSSRHGQKGVIGIRVAQSDMPFSEQGIVPDIIMNPHGFPSRMTVGKLLELISGKAGTLDGKYLDSSAFADKEICSFCTNNNKNLKTEKSNKFSLNQLYSEKCSCKDVAFKMGEILQAHGFSFNGEDAFISGTTGEYLKSYIFTGPVYYQRLKHLVADKIHARALGKKTFLTRQPLEGRAKDGGLRLGEMERDCLLAYGASEVLFERFLIASDDYTCLICEACGIIGCQGKCYKSKQNGINIIKK